MSNGLKSYKYSVLRYAHDVSTGEALNIGIVVYSPANGYLKAKVNQRYSRLSDAFASFDGSQYLRVIGGLSSSIERKAATLAEDVSPLSLPLEQPKEDVRDVLLQIWSDPGLSYQFGETLGGIAEDLDEALDSLYFRFVIAQSETQRRQRRTDKQVWVNSFQDVLRREKITDQLEERVFQVGDFDYKFEYAFKNGYWHALQPVTMDYVDTSSIKDRVNKIIGETEVLSTRTDLQHIYLLVGKPTDPTHFKAYEEALEILDTTLNRGAINHRIVPEEEAESFARTLSDYMTEHGLKTRA